MSSNSVSRKKYDKLKDKLRLYVIENERLKSQLGSDYQKEMEELRLTISKQERELILKDGRIQQLQEAKKDMKERYDELKEDLRNCQNILYKSHVQ